MQVSKYLQEVPLQTFKDEIHLKFLLGQISTVKLEKSKNITWFIYVKLNMAPFKRRHNR